MFLSIIIPVYNCEKYLGSCLHSCVSQDIPVTDYEILCINDGSVDGSAEILKRFSRQYNHIRVFSQENKGVSAARNIGLDNARGEYIMFVDSDDLLCENILKKLQSAVRKSDCTWMTFGGFVGKSEEIEGLHESVPKPNCCFPGLVWLGVYRREIIEKNHVRFIEGVSYSEDLLFVNDYKNVCTESVSFPETVYLYRSESTTFHSMDGLRRKTQSLIRLMAICKDRCSDASYSGKLNYEFWNVHVRYLLRNIPLLDYPVRYQTLLEVKRSKPYLWVNKKSGAPIDPKLQGKIKRSSFFRRLEINVYANRLGAHLIVLRRKITDTKLFYAIKHPRRVLKRLKPLRK